MRQCIGFIRRYLGLIVAGVLLVTLLIVTVYGGAQMKKKIQAGEEKLMVLNSKSVDETRRAKDLAKMKERMKSDDYKEQVAKDQLGLIRDGEIIFKKSDKKDKTDNGAQNAIEPEEIDRTDTDPGLEDEDPVMDTGDDEPETDTDNN